MARTWIDWFGEVLGPCKLTGCGDLFNARAVFFTFFTSSQWAYCGEKSLHASLCARLTGVELSVRVLTDIGYFID
jgi:hypothetical protein